MNEKLIQYIQGEVTALARGKYPNNEKLQWIYVYGFVSAQLAGAVQHDNRILGLFKQAVQAAKIKD